MAVHGILHRPGCHHVNGPPPRAQCTSYGAGTFLDFHSKKPSIPFPSSAPVFAVCHGDFRPCVPHDCPSRWGIPTPLWYSQCWGLYGGTGGLHFLARTLVHTTPSRPVASPPCVSPQASAREQTLPLRFPGFDPVARAHACRGRPGPPSSFHFCALSWSNNLRRSLWHNWVWDLATSEAALFHAEEHR